jgi:succinate dehydrogenase/fumarate reductase iron-sulfur protein
MAQTHPIKVRILRSNTSLSSESHYDDFEVEAESGSSVSDVLEKLNRQHDGALAYQVSCRRGVCGCCTIKVNGRPKLACCTEAKGDLTLEPLSTSRAVKDLVMNDPDPNPRK